MTGLTAGATNSNAKCYERETGGHADCQRSGPFSLVGVFLHCRIYCNGSWVRHGLLCTTRVVLYFPGLPLWSFPKIYYDLPFYYRILLLNSVSSGFQKRFFTLHLICKYIQPRGEIEKLGTDHKHAIFEVSN